MHVAAAQNVYEDYCNKFVSYFTETLKSAVEKTVAHIDESDIDWIYKETKKICDIEFEHIKSAIRTVANRRPQELTERNILDIDEKKALARTSLERDKAICKNELEMGKSKFKNIKNEDKLINEHEMIFHTILKDIEELQEIESIDERELIIEKIKYNINQSLKENVRESSDIRHARYSRFIFKSCCHDEGLLDTVEKRLHECEYTHAIKDAFIYLTRIIRDKTGDTEDGEKLIANAFKRKPLLMEEDKTLSEISRKNEIDGIKLILLGLYKGIRNPRSHDPVTDDKDKCVRILIMIDTLLMYINRQTDSDDISKVVDRIFDPYFVEEESYVESIISPLPVNRYLEIFSSALERREEGSLEKIKLAFHYLYYKMSADDFKIAAKQISEMLRNEMKNEDVSKILWFVTPEMWLILEDDARLRTENMIIEVCRQGHCDLNGVVTRGHFGRWGGYFGKYFKSKDRLIAVIKDMLRDSWYTQNYIGNFYLEIIFEIVTESKDIEELASGLAYALVDNKAIHLRRKFIKYAPDIPNIWKNILVRELNIRKIHDKSYVNEVVSLLS